MYKYQKLNKRIYCTNVYVYSRGEVGEHQNGNIYVLGIIHRLHLAWLFAATYCSKCCEFITHIG